MYIFTPEEIQVISIPEIPKGGMRVGTTPKGVRVKHIPTGLIVDVDSERSQHLNRDKAFAELNTLLLANK